jgi:class 3 adenylate cyclase
MDVVVWREGPFNRRSRENRNAPKDTAERRQVAVMFSDLVGSTALSARMGPGGPARGHFGLSGMRRRDWRRFGGFVAKYMGDGVLIYVGYPHAMRMT